MKSHASKGKSSHKEGYRERTRKFTFDEKTLKEREGERRHDVEISNMKQRHHNSSSNKDIRDIVDESSMLHSLKTASESMYSENEMQDYYSSDASASEVYEADETYYEERNEESAVYYEEQSDEEEKGEVYEYVNLENINRNSPVGKGQAVDADSFCASTITSRWEDNGSPRMQNVSSPVTNMIGISERSIDRIDEKSETETRDSESRNVFSPVSLPDNYSASQDKYLIDNASSTSGGHRSNEISRKEGLDPSIVSHGPKTSKIDEYNWYPNSSNSKAKNGGRKDKNLSVHIDSLETEVSTQTFKFNGVPKKVQTSIVAYSPSPTSRNESSSDESESNEFGIEVVQMSVSNSSYEKNLDSKKRSLKVDQGSRTSLSKNGKDENVDESVQSTEQSRIDSNNTRRKKNISTSSEHSTKIGKNLKVRTPFNNEGEERDDESNTNLTDDASQLFRGQRNMDETRDVEEESEGRFEVREVKEVKEEGFPRAENSNFTNHSISKNIKSKAKRYTQKPATAEQYTSSANGFDQKEVRNIQYKTEGNHNHSNNYSEIDSSHIEEVPTDTRNEIKDLERRIVSSRNRLRRGRPNLTLPKDLDDNDYSHNSTVTIPESVPSAKEILSKKASLVGKGISLKNRNRSIQQNERRQDDDPIDNTFESDGRISSPEMVLSSKQRLQRQSRGKMHDRKMNEGMYVKSKQRQGSKNPTPTAASEVSDGGFDKNVSIERDAPEITYKQNFNKRSSTTTKKYLASSSSPAHRKEKVTNGSSVEPSQVDISVDDFRTKYKRKEKVPPNKRVTIAFSGSGKRVLQKTHEVSTCRSHVESLIKGGIFTQSSPPVKDLLTILTEHEKLREESSKMNEEARSWIHEKEEMSKLIYQLQKQLEQTGNSDRIREEDDNNKSKETADMRKEIESLQEENKARERDFIGAQEQISFLEKELNAKVDSMNDNKEQAKLHRALKEKEGMMKTEIDTLKKNNTYIKNKYDEKLRKAENAISSLEHALQAQILLQKEEKKNQATMELHVREKSDSLLEFEEKCQELELKVIELETMNEKLVSNDAQSQLRINDLQETQRRIVEEYEDKLNRVEKLRLSLEQSIDEEDVEGLKEQISLLEVETRKFEDINADLNETNKSLSDEKIELQRQLKLLNDEYEAMESKYKNKINNLSDVFKSTQDATDLGTQDLFNAQEHRISVLETNVRKLESLNGQLEEKNKYLMEENETLNDQNKELISGRKAHVEKLERKLRSANETIDSLQKALDSQVSLQNELSHKNITMEMKLLTQVEQNPKDVPNVKFADEGADKVGEIRKHLEETLRRNVSLGACIATLKSMLPDDDSSLVKQFLLMTKKVEIQKTELEKALREALLREMKMSQLFDQIRKNEEQIQEKFKLKTNLEAELHSMKLNLDDANSMKGRLSHDLEKVKQTLEECQNSKSTLTKEVAELSKKLGASTKKASRVSELELQLKKSEDKSAALEREKSYIKQQSQILQSKIDREMTLNEKRAKQQEENYNRIMKDLELALEKKSALETQNSSLKEKLFKVETTVGRVPELEGVIRNYDSQVKNYKDKLNDLNSRVLELEALKRKQEDDRNSLHEELLSSKKSRNILESQAKELEQTLENMRVEFGDVVKFVLEDTELVDEPNEINSLPSLLKMFKNSVEKEISNLRNRNDELVTTCEERVKSLEGDILSRKKNFKELEEQRKKLSNELDVSKSQQEELSKNLSEKEALISRLNNKLEDFKRTKRELDEANSRVESLDMELSNMKRRLFDAEETITKAEETRSSMKIQISILEESRQASSETIERQYETLSKVQEDLENSKSRERKLQIELDALKANLEEMEKEYGIISSATETLQEESKTLRERLYDTEALSARVPGLENLIKGYEEVVLSQKDDLSTLHEEKLSLMDSVDKLQNEILVYQTRFSEKQEEVSMTMKEIDIVIKKKNELEEEVENLKLKINDFSNNSTKAQYKISELEQSVKDYEDTIAQMRNESSSLLTAMDTKVSDIMEENRTLISSLNDKSRVLEKYKSKLRHHDDTIQSQERMIEAEGEAFDSLQKKHTRLEEQLSNLRNEKNEIERKLVQVELSLEDSNLEKENQRNEINSLMNEMNDIKHVKESLSEEVNELTFSLNRAKENLCAFSETQAKLDEAEANLSHQKRVQTIDQENYVSLVESMRTELLKVSTEKNELKTECRTLKEFALENENARNKLEIQLREGNAEFTKYESNLKEKQKTIDALNLEIKNLHSRISLISKEKENFQRDAAKAQSNSSEKVIEALQDEVKKMRKKLGDSEEKAANSLHAELSLRSKLTSFESEHRDLKKEARAAKHRNLMMEKELQQNIELLEKAKRALANKR